jgi:acyl-CoA thioesterase
VQDPLIRLHHSGENLWLGEGDPRYTHPAGLFGGWTAAALLSAVGGEPGDRGEPLSLTVLYADAVLPSPLEISTRLLRSGSRLQFWRAELRQDERLRADAQITFGVRRRSFSFVDVTCPDAPPPEAIPSAAPPPETAPFFRQFETRWVTTPPQIRTGLPARSLFWLRNQHGRRLDAPGLAAIADFAPPRTFYFSTALRPSSTVSMNVYFHATRAELAEVEDDFVLSDVRARRCESGYYDHEVRIWSRSGALLATSEQVAAFRD